MTHVCTFVEKREASLMDDNDYVLGRSDAEYDRLIEQAALMRPFTERMLRVAGIGPGMHVLDIGCGMGDVSFLVSDLVGPEGSVVGIDLDGVAIRRADERRAARGVSNVAFRQGDARSVRSERLFDAAVGRFVLQFIRDPTPALRMIAECVRPGGIVAFHEGVAGISPASSMNLPVLASLLHLIIETHERSGARMQIGAELYGRMRDAGLEPDSRPPAEVPMCVGQSETAFRRWSLMTRSILPKIVEYGLATEDAVLDIVERQLKAELTHVEGLLPLHWLMIGQWARKP